MKKHFYAYLAFFKIQMSVDHLYDWNSRRLLLENDFHWSGALLECH